jgi:hypothetical protein
MQPDVQKQGRQMGQKTENHNITTPEVKNIKSSMDR